MQQMSLCRRNAAYLPDFELSPRLRLTADRDGAISHASAGLTFVATPISGLRSTLNTLPATQRVIWLCKGFEAGTGRLGHEIAREVQPSMSVGVLSGPSFAQEIAAGRPSALVAASKNAELNVIVADALHDDRLRIYTSGDPIGVEIGGAVKNVLAIATGVCDALFNEASDAPGLNARAALITRGLNEMRSLGIALGANAETFLGLSALGDLVLTATGGLSRNRQVGLLLAQGLALPHITAKLGHVAEGVFTAPMVLARAREHGVEMPICESVVGLLDGKLSIKEVVRHLTGRRPGGER